MRNLKDKLKNISIRLRHPYDYLADFIYRIYDYDKDKIPIPLLNFIVSRYGGWAGMGLYFIFRGHEEKLKREKRLKILRNIVFPIIVISVISFGFFQEKEGFFFGFSQNLLADVVLILLAIYILPQFLNKPKIYRVSLKNDCFIEDNHTEKFQVVFKVKNDGKEVFHKDEIFWELYISSELIDQQDIKFINGDYESENNDIPITSWKFFGLITKPLFLDQEIILLKVLIKKQIVQTQLSFPQIYYRFRTIGGNFPTFENVTRAFLGAGYSAEYYPNLGEYVIENYPEYAFEQEPPEPVG